VMRPEGRAPVQIAVGALTTYGPRRVPLRKHHPLTGASWVHYSLPPLRAFIPFILLAAAVGMGCSTVRSRKTERAEAYNALSPRYRALVDEGFIDVGMNTNAVYIAWGKPYQIMRVDFPTGERTVWVYTGASQEKVSSWQYRPTASPVSSWPTSSPYRARPGTYERTTTTVLRRRTNGWVSFENGMVVSFDSYAPSGAR